MYSNCPDCEQALRNPHMCSCGWKLSRVTSTSTPSFKIDEAQRQRNREHSRAMMEFVTNLTRRKAYEPGADQ